MRRTKILKESQYQGIPLSLQDVIARHVQKEENLWIKSEPTPTPEYKEVTVVKPPWLTHLLKGTLGKITELRP